MPKEAIDRVSSIGRQQSMPSTITYANRHGTELGDTIATYNHNDDTSESDSDNDSYSDGSTSDDDSLHADDYTTDDSDSDADSGSTSSDDSDNDSDDGDMRIKDAEAATNPHILPPIPAEAPLIVVPPDPVAPHHAPNQGVDHAGNPGVDNPGVDDDLNASDEDDDTVNEENNDGEQNDNDNDSSSQNSTNNQIRTESERFRTAENDGRARATQPNSTRPIRNARSTRYDDFAYTTFDFIHRTIGIRLPD
jgi:hypothetical protein